MIKVMPHTIKSNLIRKDLNIVHLSDLHFNSDTPKEKLDKIYQKVEGIKPDLIVFSGDIYFGVVNGGKNELLLDFFRKLASRFPIYYVLGNQDLVAIEPDINPNDHCFIEYDRTEELNKINNIPGITYLKDSTTQIYLPDYNVNLAGVNLSHNYYQDEKNNDTLFILEANSSYPNPLEKEFYNILSCHSPNHLLRKPINKVFAMTNANLVLCGHTHYGAVPYGLGVFLPKNRGLKTSSGEWFPKNSRGKLRLGKDLWAIIGGPLTTLPESKGNIARFANTIMPSRMEKVLIKTK